MATVSSLGAGSGLNLGGLLENLMKIEREPLDNLKARVSSFNTKISAMGTLASKLSALQTTAKGLKPEILKSPLEKFGTFTGSVANGDVATASVGMGASTGSYSLEVTRLAQAQKSRISSSDLNIGGQIDFTFADSTKNFSVTPTGGSLSSVANAINQAGKGITATIVNSDSGPQLVLTGEQGDENAFSISGAGVTGPVQTVQAAQDARLKIDGIEISSASNAVKDAVTGVTFNLKATNIGEPTTVSVTADYSEKLKKAMEGLVKSFNDAIGTIKSLGAYNAEDPKATGALNGNRVLREAQSALRDLVFQESNVTDSSGEKMTLSRLGITFQKDGTLALDEDKFRDAVADNPELMANFAADIGNRFNNSLNKMTSFDGMVQSVTDSMRSNVRMLEKRQQAMELRVETIEARYRKQFTALDSLVSSMNSTSSFLVQQLSMLSR